MAWCVQRNPAAITRSTCRCMQCPASLLLLADTALGPQILPATWSRGADNQRQRSGAPQCQLPWLVMSYVMPVTLSVKHVCVDPVVG